MDQSFPISDHLIEADLGEDGDDWLTCATGAEAEILAGLGQRLAAEARMDEFLVPGAPKEGESE